MARATASATRIGPARPASSHTRADRSILVAIHDVSPRFEREVATLRDRLSRFVPADRIAMLVIPDHWGTAKLTPGTPFAHRLRAWADEGTEMFAHGWFHKDDSTHAGRLAQTKARHLTAGEGEFLGLSHAEARRRMIDGRDLIEGITGRPVSGFIAPAWLYGDGARSAAREVGFDLCEDHFRVWRPADDRVVARGPVISWASRSKPRIASSLAASFVLRHALKRAPIVRVAVHPGDVTVSALLTSIDRTMAALSPGRQAIRYADLSRRAA